LDNEYIKILTENPKWKGRKCMGYLGTDGRMNLTMDHMIELDVPASGKSSGRLK
jgi:hypothetical protein